MRVRPAQRLQRRQLPPGPSAGSPSITETSATFNGEDHIVVSVNGVAQPERTCDDYLAFINH